MKKNILLVIFTFLTLLGLSEGTLVLAQPDLGVSYPAAAGLSNIDPRIAVANIIRVALGVLGTVFLVIVLYGGFLWMTAGGNEDRVGHAKQWILSGTIGLAIILSSYGITSYVLYYLTAATVGVP